MRHFRCLMIALGGLWMIVAFSTAAHAASYADTILTSDIQGLGTFTDPNLKNPWGFGYSLSSPFWNGDQTTAVSSLYGASGAVNALVVSIPPGPAPGNVGPTGVTSNSFSASSPGDFVIPTALGGNGRAASFIFDTLNGTLAAWNSGTTAVTVFTATNGAVYTGLAEANNGTQNQLYAADNHNGVISVFGPTFNPVTPSGNFVDPNLPAGSLPYNIELINGKLYVTYQGSTGSIGVFDLNGNFLQGISDSHLISAWGMALAPAGFGQFGGDLLVGNKGNGQIDAFNPNTLSFVGTLLNSSGQPISHPGLWALAFRAPGNTGGFDPNTLYFNAGYTPPGVTPLGGNFFPDGIFGTITAVPEPSSVILLGLGMIVACGFYHWQVRRRRSQAKPALGSV